jgi:putative membrane protein
MKAVLLIAPLIVALGATGVARGPGSALSHTDRVFLGQALNGNTQEIRQAQIFANSSDPLVSAFAQRMSTDHSEANVQLIGIADRHKISTAGQAPSLPYRSVSHAAWMNAQQKATIMAGQPPVDYFEKQMALDRSAIALYRNEIAHGSSRALVAYARKTLPVLEQHLTLARQDLHAEKGNHHGR